MTQVEHLQPRRQGRRRDDAADLVVADDELDEGRREGGREVAGEGVVAGVEEVEVGELTQVGELGGEPVALELEPP